MKKSLLIIILLILSFLVFGIKVNSFKLRIDTQVSKSSQILELEQILGSKEVGKQRELLRLLLEKHDPLEVQEILKRSLPPTGNAHLLGHDVGDFVYEKYGDRALIYCKAYFLYACYHGVVIKQIANQGIGGLEKLLKVCKEGGEETYYQCAHSIGHGFLAWQDYDLLKALGMCDEISGFDNFLAQPCYRGVFMENIHGLHRGTPIPIEDNPWLSERDPYYPCNSVSERYRSACWYHQASRIYDMVRGKIKGIAQLCEEAPKRYKLECFNGLSRRINTLTGGKSDQIIKLCQILGESWRDYCIRINAGVAILMGDKYTPFVLCSALSEENISCWRRVFAKFSP